MRYITLGKFTVDIHSVKSAKHEGKFLIIRYKDNEIDKCEYNSEDESKKYYKMLNGYLEKVGKVSAKLL